MAFAILQGMTMVSEEVIESQYIKVIDKNDISSVLSFMSALRKHLNNSSFIYYFKNHYR